jgi:hypothetical protein
MHGATIKIIVVYFTCQRWSCYTYGPLITHLPASVHRTRVEAFKVTMNLQPPPPPLPASPVLWN